MDPNQPPENTNSPINTNSQLVNSVSPIPQPPAPPENINQPPVQPPPQTPRVKTKSSFLTVFFILILLLILVGGGVFAYQKFIRNPTSIATTTPSPSESLVPAGTGDPTTSWKTYTNSILGFELKYPETLILYENKDKAKIVSLSYIPICDIETTNLCLYYPPDQYAGTNFKGAGLSVNILEENISAKICGTLNQSVGSKVINGMTFTVGEDTGVALGNQSQDTIYRIFHSNKCFDIVIRINTDSSDVNSPPGTVKKFTESEKATVLSLFEQILSTFKLTDQAGKTADWKTYADKTAGFEIKYPSNWTYFIKSPTKGTGNSNLAPYYGKVNFTGSEGQIELVFGNGFGGQTCQDSGGEIIKIKIGTYDIPLCNYKKGNNIYYGSPFGDAGGPEINNTSYNFTFFYQSSTPNSLEFIKNILSTFNFI